MNTSYEKNAELTVYAANRYEMTMQDFGDLSNRLATASTDSKVLHAVLEKDGQQGEWETMSGSYKEAVFKGAGLQIGADGIVTTASVKIEMDRTGSQITTTINDTDVYMTTLRADMQASAAAVDAITKEAAPNRMTFRPAAVRYELGKEDVDKLASTISGLYNPDGIYRLTSSNKDESTVGKIDMNHLFDLMECKRLASGNATMRDKAISVFRLSNGFTVKIGSTYLLVATEAAPKYKAKDEVLFTVIHPDGNGQIYRGVIGNSLGYDANLADFAYIVTDAQGNSQPVSEKYLLPVVVDETMGTTDVPMTHF